MGVLTGRKATETAVETTETTAVVSVMDIRTIKQLRAEALEEQQQAVTKYQGIVARFDALLALCASVGVTDVAVGGGKS